MAKPIKITPVLRGKDAAVFNQTVKTNNTITKSNSSKYVSKLKSMKESYAIFQTTLSK